jgi:hypothetical protein
MPSTVLGEDVEFSQVIGNLILISFTEVDDTKRIGLFKSGTQKIFDYPFEIDQQIGYSMLEDVRELACLHKLTNKGVKVTIMKESALEEADNTFEINEFNTYKFSFP